MAADKLTPYQKMQAVHNAFYCGGVKWLPKKGDYYTTVRNDLELYRIVDEDDEFVYTCYCTDPTQNQSKWRKDEFTTSGFGPNRICVQDWILGLDPSCRPLVEPDNYYPLR